MMLRQMARASPLGLRQATLRSSGRAFLSVEPRRQRKVLRQDSEMMTARGESIAPEIPNSVESLNNMLQGVQNDAAREVVPWFLDNMPEAYFRQVPEHLRQQHLRALAALHGSGASPEITLRSEDGTVTLIRAGNYPGQLLGMMQHLPKGRPLQSVNVFSAKDGSIALNVFSFQNSFTEAFTVVPESLREYTAKLLKGDFANAAPGEHAAPASYFEEEQLYDYVRRCQPSYVANSSPRRFCKQIEMYHNMLDHSTDDVAIDVEHNWVNSNSSMITLAITNVLPMACLIKVSRLLASLGIDIKRTHLDVIQSTTNADAKAANGAPLSAEQAEDEMHAFAPRSNVTMLRLLVAPYENQDGRVSSVIDNHELLSAELPRFAKWLGDDAIELVVSHQITSLQAELVTCFASLAHSILAPSDQYQFAKSRIKEVLLSSQHRDLVFKLLDIFERRFNPSTGRTLTEGEFTQQLDALESQVANMVDVTEARGILLQVVGIIRGTYRTNAFVKGRYALALRLDPALMMPALGAEHVNSEVPYGIFFVHGRRFNGFHVRFRDIARGGLRMVTPPNAELMSIESGRHFKECYDLAYAQQLKNKDIAEGGSKAVCLVDQTGMSTPENRNHVLRKCVKSFTNSLLDMITEEPNTRGGIVSRQQLTDETQSSTPFKELVYLGPDEQIIPEDIDWIIERARQRKYIVPSAFMSSKPRAGINHKVYGVTSEGVAVFLDVALEAVLGRRVSKEEPFTVKITGGPDGDVAGNMLKILDRDYGEAARVVGMADGTACLEDPQGIAMEELLRLFHAAEPLAQFDKTKLGSQGKLHIADTPEGVHMRNTMHNRVEADAFVPAGGRPATINEKNYKDFMTAPGVPSSKLVVEGANLFLTPGARALLAEEAGVVVVKDSSANKCGVICSSYEIISSMLLSEDEFVDNKSAIVDDVLVKLRSLARFEAEYMFREYRRDPSQPLPPVSMEISKAIIRAHDAVSARLTEMGPEALEAVLPIARHALPAKIAEMAWDRAQDNIPAEYLRELVASAVASHLVYDEGIQYVNAISEDMLAETALRYIEQEQAVIALVERVRDASKDKMSAEDMELLGQLLRRGGARAAVELGGVQEILAKAKAASA